MVAADGGGHVVLRDHVPHDAVVLAIGVAVHVLRIVRRLGPLELVQVESVDSTASLGLIRDEGGGGGGRIDVEHAKQ